jgi:CRP-like cAMP-binding protein
VVTLVDASVNASDPVPATGTTAGKSLSNEPNRILRTLPQIDRERLSEQMQPFTLDRGEVLHQAGAPVHHVYFPTSGLVSLLTVMKDGRAVETGILGADGVVGGAVAFGQPVALHEATVQISGQSLRLPTAAFVSACRSSPALTAAVQSVQFVLLLAAQQNAACHALHEVEARLCRWLLGAADVVGSPTLELTHAFLSQMLGVRRSSVTDAAKKLQATGAVRFRRGTVEIRDSERLKHSACECYEFLRRETGRRLP